ncbi:MAG: hypothetical protein U0W40_18420 [Acidimicrobiia bacterium]
MGRRGLVWLFVGVACLLLLVQSGQVTSSDGNSSLQVTRSLVDHGSVTVPRNAGVPGADGTTVSKYGLGLPLLAAAPYAASQVVAAVVGHDRELGSFAAASLMPLICAGIAVAAYALGRRLGGSAGTAALVALGTTLGTFLLAYSKEFFSEPLVCLCLLLCLLAVSAKRPAWAAAALGYACLTRPQMLLLVPVFLVVIFVTDRRRVWQACAVLAGFVVLMCAYNLARYGDAFRFSYPGEDFSGDPLHATRELFLDPDKSLLLFVPAVIFLPWSLVALWRRARDVTVLMAANLAIGFVTTIFWHDWGGGWAWEPRLLLPGIIVALPSLAPWVRTAPWRTWAVAATFAVGFVVSFPALLVPTQAQQLDAGLHTSPAIVRQYELIEPTARYTADHLTDQAQAGTGSHRKYLSLWQANAGALLGKGGLALAAIVSIGLAVLALFALRRWRATLRDPN